MSALATVAGDDGDVVAADATSIYATTLLHVAPPPGGFQPVPLLKKFDQQTGAIVELAAQGVGVDEMLADDRELFFRSGSDHHQRGSPSRAAFRGPWPICRTHTASGVWPRTTLKFSC